MERYVGVLEDLYNLQRWEKRMVALGLVERPDLRLSVSAHSDDKATLDRCLEETADSARQLFDDAIQRLLRPYVDDDRAPFPERRHIAALVAAFVADYLHLIERWSEFARDEIRRWPRTDGLGMTDRTREILDTLLTGESVLDPGR